jgi:hypothetical protein
MMVTAVPDVEWRSMGWDDLHTAGREVCMDGGFQVDFDALEQAAAGVSGVIDLVGRQQVSNIPCDSSSLGNDQLATSMSDFLSRWQRGVSNLAQDGHQIASRLAASASNYRRAEASVTHTAQGILKGTGADPGAR